MKKPLMFGVILVVLLLIYLISIPTMMKMKVPIEEKASRPSQKEAPLPTLAPPDLSKIVENEIKNLSPGRILFNPPTEMKLGVNEKIEVRITKKITEDLTKGIEGRGIPKIEKIKVGPVMEVSLKGNNFDIKLLSPKEEEQLVTGEGYAKWLWEVVPLKSGIQSLYLSVAVVIYVDHSEKKHYSVLKKEIKVKINPIYTTQKFIENNWKWIITTIVSSGIIGWIINKRRKSRKKK